MKIKPLFIICFIVSFTASSQEYIFGIKGGVNYNYIGDFLSQEGSYYSAENEIGYQFGVFTEVSFNKLFVRPEANYVSLKNSYVFPLKTAKWAAQQIDIPILFGYKVSYPIAIYTGPVFSFITDMTMEGWQDTPYADPFIYNASSTSICAGILLDFDRVGVDIRYQYGITSVKEQRLDMIKTYNGYGVNLGDLLDYNGSQLLVSAHVNIINIGRNDGRRRGGSKFNWRESKINSNKCF